MIAPAGQPDESQFLLTYVPLLLGQFFLTYEQDDDCVEYFLYSRKKQMRISKNLIVSHDVFSHSLYVSKFYPEIYKELSSKYLSAACFYMMARHAVGLFHLADNCRVHLEAETAVFENFYLKLKEFQFKIRYNRPACRVAAEGNYHAFPFSTDMIKEENFTQTL